jgi:hypothetical protein
LKNLNKIFGLQPLGLILLILISNFSYGQDIINPTGTYVYQGKTTKKDGDTYGYFGTIQVKKISDKKIIMTFYICKGAPSYNSGSFVDTLEYIDNKAVFKDEGIVTQFSFDNNGVDIKEIEYNGAYWGQGVYAHGRFKKKSKKEPILTEPLTGEKL